MLFLSVDYFSLIDTSPTLLLNYLHAIVGPMCIRSEIRKAQISSIYSGSVCRRASSYKSYSCYVGLTLSHWGCYGPVNRQNVRDKQQLDQRIGLRTDLHREEHCTTFVGEGGGRFYCLWRCNFLHFETWFRTAPTTCIQVLTIAVEDCNRPTVDVTRTYSNWHQSLFICTSLTVNRSSVTECLSIC